MVLGYRLFYFNIAEVLAIYVVKIRLGRIDVLSFVTFTVFLIYNFTNLDSDIINNYKSWYITQRLTELLVKLEYFKITVIMVTICNHFYHMRLISYPTLND